MVLAVIMFPWVFTVYISLHEWEPGGGASWVGLGKLRPSVHRCRLRLGDLAHAVFLGHSRSCAPLVLGIAAALCFHKRFALRGLARTMFILPMMATPVAVALVWTMMFHPQLGVLNYILTSSACRLRNGPTARYGDPDAGDGGDLAMDAAW